MKTYDVIIIGTGACNIIADAAIEQHKSVAIIERGRFGGTCLNRGCIPTKILVTAANTICACKEASRIGVSIEGVRFDWQKVTDRLQAKLAESPGIKDYYAAFPEVQIYEGTASFVDNKTLTVTYSDGTTEAIQGEQIFIGTGGETNIPNLPGLTEAGYVTSETFFTTAYPKEPYKSLIILGGGPIGCEFAHVFNAAGTDVTLVQHNVRLLPKEDEDISAFLLNQFQDRDIHVELNKDTLSVRVEGDKKIVTIQDRTTKAISEVRADEILVAPGIRPMTKLLHLENTDVTLDKRGYIETNEFLETVADGIFAIGDVNGKAPFRHKANYEAEILADNLFSGKAPSQWRWADYDTVPAVTYTYPEAAHVGLTEKDAQEKGYDVQTAINHYSTSAKGYALGFEEGQRDDGFIKLVIDRKTQAILGAHIIGVEASILIQPFVNLLSWGMKVVKPINEHIASSQVAQLRSIPLSRYLDPRLVTTLDQTMTPHPSLSEVTMWTRYYNH